jgi:hypothetical protein
VRHRHREIGRPLLWATTAIAWLGGLAMPIVYLETAASPHGARALSFGVAFGTLGVILVLVTGAFGQRSSPFILGMLFYLAVAIVTEFAAIYAISGATDFGAPLGRVDALYLSVGNLTAVAHPDIVPRTEHARELALAQMIVDLLYLALLVALALPRLLRRSWEQIGARERHPARHFRR